MYVCDDVHYGTFRLKGEKQVRVRIRKTNPRSYATAAIPVPVPTVTVNQEVYHTLVGRMFIEVKGLGHAHEGVKRVLARELGEALQVVKVERIHHI